MIHLTMHSTVIYTTISSVLDGIHSGQLAVTSPYRMVSIRLLKMGCKVVTKGVENKKGACDCIVTT